MVKFLDLGIGDLFISHNILWVKISRESAKSRQYGCCNFTLDEWDKHVHLVNFKEVEIFVLNNYET